MFRDLQNTNCRQRGMGLISAIFLIIVVSVLVLAIVRSVRTSAEAFAQDVVSERAFLAAESGSQLGLNRLFAPDGAGTCTDRVWSLDDVGLRFCQATVACRTETVAGSNYYTLSSDGRCDIGGVIAERRVLVRARP